VKNRFFPNESGDYRRARSELLAAEDALRTQIEEVAALRRKLPLGGALKEDYVFEQLDRGRNVTQLRLSELFAPGKDSLFLYSYMYGPKQKQPCVMCTSIIDGLNGNARHITQRINMAIVAKSPIERIVEVSESRDWNDLRVLSSVNNTYNYDYQAEDEDENQWPMANVFVRRNGTIHHYWASELMFHEFATGNTRHVDTLWPLWNVLDLTPEGRGDDWYPALSYEE
jgi:predicted dithiol-disulfide oxidoreductase (DUF899 family)